MNLSFTFYAFYTDDHVKLKKQKLTVQCNISSSVNAFERTEEEVS